MRSNSSLTSTNKLPKLLPLALSALITFAPLIYFANHLLKLDRKNPLQQVVEMRLLEDLIKPILLPKQLQQQVVPKMSYCQVLSLSHFKIPELKIQSPKHLCLLKFLSQKH